MAAPFLFHVFPSSGVPIYRQIMDQVGGHIAAGRLKPGEFLPSVRQVAGELQVNPMTVSKAYSLLERDGVIECVRGQGMQVAERRATRLSLREREEAVRSLLKQAVARAYQSALSPERVRTLLEPLLEDLKQP